MSRRVYRTRLCEGACILAEVKEEEEEEEEVLLTAYNE